jgi:branched-chain amino acid transport system substrate-binding protein
MKTKSKIFLLLISAVILSLLLWAGLKFFQEDNVAIHIAFVGPMSGENAEVGQSMAQAIQLYLDTLGGINHQKIVLDIFDDQNDVNKAIKVAQDIVKQNRAVAVIGHYYSACSINAGKIYKRQGIPAITPASTHIEVTQDNEWYFRTVFNDNLQARFLAYYAKRILLQNTVSIISTDDAYGSSLVSLFETASKNLIDIKYKWLLSSSSNNLEEQMAQIVSDLQTKPDAGLIFLATHAPEGVKLVKLMRDAEIKNPLMAPDSYAGKSFSQGFLNEPKEKLTPGYYTNDIYVSTPFLLDTANRQAHAFNTLYQKQFQEKTPWHAFYAVDAAMVLIEAIKQANIQGQSLVADRKKIRDIISNDFNTYEHAVEGTTGLNYFDDNGDVLKSVLMGVYKNNHLISAFNQLQIIPHSPEKIDQLDLARKEERILLIDDQYMYKTDVVYTGIQLNSISDFNPKTVTYTLDFYLWFRFQGTINPQQIQFLNAVEPIQLGTPLIEETFGKETYLLYRVKGHFKENVYSSKHQISLIQKLLSINFRHRDLDRNHLIYVTDFLGMELTKETSLLDIVKELQERSTLALDKWNLEEINLFQGILKQKMLGNPKYLVPGNTTEYSTFNAEGLISSKAYAYHTLIPSQFVLGFLVFSGVMTLLLMLVSYKDKKVIRLKYLWIYQVIFLLLLLVSTEMFVIRWIIEDFHLVPLETVRIVFEVLWWIMPAILLNMAIERFFWLPLEETTGRSVPTLMRFVTAFVIYTLALFGVIAFVFEKPITSLLATSGVVTVIIGLAIQMNLSNVFSGIALNIDRSLRIGDWVKIGSFDDSRVVNMNWRVTQIETRRGYIVSIPNSTVANSDIHNFSYPDDQYWLRCRVPIEPKYDPRKVEEILLNAVLSVEEGVVKDFKPFIWMENIQLGSVNNEFVTNYVVFFKTENYQKKFRVLKEVWKNIWIHLNRAGIILAATNPPNDGEEEQKTVFTTPELEKVLNKNQLQDMVVDKSLGRQDK